MLENLWLRRYETRKIVDAAMIVGISESGEHIRIVDRNDETRDIETPSGLFARGRAKVGDYLVKYRDGYVSWSPKAAFEESATPCDGAPHTELPPAPEPA